MSTPTAEDPEKQIGERKGYIQMCKPPKSVPSCRLILPCSVCFGLSEVSIAGTRWRLRELSLLMQPDPNESETACLLLMTK